MTGCEEKIWIVSWLTLRDYQKRFGHKPSVGDMKEVGRVLKHSRQGI